jgi:hypothetical protein
MVAQLNYNFKQRAFLPGQRADAGRPNDVDSYNNPINAQANTVTFGGTPTDGVYSVLIEQLGAPPVLASTTRSTTPATNNDLATAFAAEINTNSAFRNLVTATPASAVVTLNFLHPNIAYTLTTSAPGPGTLVNALTTAPGGTFQRVGMFVARASGAADRAITPITTGTVIADILGIAERTFHLINGADFQLPYDAYKPGAPVAVGLSGRWAMETIEAVTPDSVPHIYIDETDTATGHVGQITASVLGGKAIIASSLRLRFRTSASAGGLTVVQYGEGA